MKSMIFTIAVGLTLIAVVSGLKTFVQVRDEILDDEKKFMDYFRYRAASFIDDDIELLKSQIREFDQNVNDELENRVPKWDQERFTDAQIKALSAEFLASQERIKTGVVEILKESKTKLCTMQCMFNREL